MTRALRTVALAAAAAAAVELAWLAAEGFGTMVQLEMTDGVQREQRLSGGLRISAVLGLAVMFAALLATMFARSLWIRPAAAATAAAVVVALAAGSVAVTRAVRADYHRRLYPYGALQRTIGRFSPPGYRRTGAVERTGGSYGDAGVTATYRASGPTPSCAELAQAAQAWLGRPASRIGRGASCYLSVQGNPIADLEVSGQSLRVDLTAG